MGAVLQLGSLPIEVVLKDIKNVHLSVHPPHGRVRIAAPSRMRLDTIRVFAISKLDWIRQQQKKLREQEREPVREYLERESHYVWGKRYLLDLVECERAPSVELRHRNLVLSVRPGASEAKKQDILDEWYRTQVRLAVAPLLASWERVLGVSVSGVQVRRMKTKWGSCSTGLRTIRLNTELAKKTLDCLEYILVHEMVHLLEPTHNDRFVALMDRFMPNWRFRRAVLNRLPVRHEEWGY